MLSSQESSSEGSASPGDKIGTREDLCPCSISGTRRIELASFSEIQIIFRVETQICNNREKSGDSV